MTSLQTIVEDAGEIATEANGVTSSTQLSTYATQVGNLIQEALQVGNTQDANGNYIFGGTATGAPPFTATTDASGNVTGVTYNGNTSVAKAEIAPGLTVSAQSPGENNTGSGAGGVFADSRTGADLFSHLISLQQNLSSGNTSAIASTDTPESDQGRRQRGHANQRQRRRAIRRWSRPGTSPRSNRPAIDSQMSNDTNADLAQTLTQLSQTQTAYQAALESGTMVMGLSLLEFLG